MEGALAAFLVVLDPSWAMEDPGGGGLCQDHIQIYQ